LSYQPGFRFGVYEIVSPLGAGGMGEVFRARDTKLGREAAIKVLPQLFVADPDRVARFQREAQLLAALNHPHIAGIYGLEEHDGARFLVMELVEGESLAARLAGGRLAIDEALAIASEIGQALEAAHEKGIVHRDLKPANIMLTADGRVKVLDFGLAKMLERDPTDSSSSLSPTLSVHATYAGMILGTAAYMSPEQARGRAVDKRTDVWAFGCVLFEMLTGKRAFEGEDVTDTIAAVVRGDPDWSALPANLPPNIRAVLSGCLQKDRKQRFSDISVPLFLMGAGAGVVPAAPAPVAARRALLRRALPAAVAAILAALVTGVVAWSLRPVPAAPVVARFPITLGDGQAFSNTGRHAVAISPDGRRIVYNANLRLWVRQLSELEARPIPGAEGLGGALGVTNPVFSPDGLSVAYFVVLAPGPQQQGALKRIAVSGGVPVTICPAANPFGMVWHGDEIVFGAGAGGIMRVPATGGKPEALITLKSNDEAAHGPQLLPGGDVVLFTLAQNAGRNTDRWDNAQLVAQSLKSGERKVLVPNASDGRYLPTGHLVYAASGVVFAVRFDLRRLAVVGGPVPVIEGVSRAAGASTGAAHFNVAENGSLVYIPGPAAMSVSGRSLAFMDREGRMELLKLPEAPYEYPRISPDGTRIAVGTDDGKVANIWIYDVSGVNNRRQLTFGGRNRVPVWTADGDRVAFQSDREGDRAIFWQRADGNGTAERLTKPEAGAEHVPQSWSSDGKQLFLTSTLGPDNTLLIYSLADKRAVPFSDVKTPDHLTAALSPDGRWVAYNNLSLGGVFVQPYPATGARYNVGVGIHPFWSPDGTELFMSPRGRFQSVKITTRPAFGFAPPVDMPRNRAFINRGPNFERDSDITPDGKRFVGTSQAREGETQAAGAVAPQIQVVEHWFEELKARVK
jgi:eukaryotic-like serine/threonine-protein kinase